MTKLLYFIKKHKLITLCIIIIFFLLPFFVLYCFNNFSCLQAIMVKLNFKEGDLLSYTAGFEAFIGTIFIGLLAFWQNHQIQIQQLESLEPVLSMKLIEINSFLFLSIENTGFVEAKNIKIDVKEIKNNANENKLLLDMLFNQSFELYPKEMVQGMIAISGRNIQDIVFPQIKVDVSYFRPDTGRVKTYSRTVTFNNGYDQKIAADINYDNSQMESSVKAMARANIRLANYFDGHKISSIDELDLMSNRSFVNDMVHLKLSNDEIPIVSREEIIQNIKKGESRNE